MTVFALVILVLFGLHTLAPLSLLPAAKDEEEEKALLPFLSRVIRGF